MGADQSTRAASYWQRAAPSYDRIMERFAPAYPEMTARVVRDAASAERVVEVAAGTGLVTLELARHVGHIEATDISDEMLEQLRRKASEAGVANVTATVRPADDLGFSGSSFDAAICANVLHLLEDPGAALAELRRVLKPRGRLIAPTYLHGHSIEAHVVSRIMRVFGLRTRSRFTATSYGALLESAGFEVERLDVLAGRLPLAYSTATRAGR